MSVFILLLVLVIVVFAVKDIRISLISRPAFKFFKKVLPPLSQTEREAMEAGDVWWDGELFSGKPDFKKLHHYPKPTLSSEEQSFIDNELETLLSMLDDHKIVKEDRDLPKEVWDEYFGMMGSIVKRKIQIAVTRLLPMRINLVTPVFAILPTK